jgi:hypothetical protein
MGSKAPITPIKANKGLLLPHSFFQSPTLIDNMGDKANSGKTRRIGIDERARRTSVI